jgi:phosphoglycolate phosphatase
MVADEYDFWLLDLDGTLVDVEPAYAHDVFDRVGDRLGYAFTDEEVEALWHGLDGTRDDRLARLGIDPERFWTVFHEEEDPIARAEATRLYDDAERLAAVDAPMGVVTHCQRYLTDPVLDTVGIRDWFDAVVCCTDDVGWKPDPAPVRRAMREMDVEPYATDGGQPVERARGVLAGDGPQDVGAAWNAGLDAIHVERHGHDRRGTCVLGDRRVTGFDDLFGGD